jgi:hypothetical protein
VKNQAEANNKLETGIRTLRILIEDIMVVACLVALSLWMLGF